MKNYVKLLQLISIVLIVAGCSQGDKTNKNSLDQVSSVVSELTQDVNELSDRITSLETSTKTDSPEKIVELQNDGIDTIFYASSYSEEQGDVWKQLLRK